MAKRIGFLVILGLALLSVIPAIAGGKQEPVTQAPGTVVVNVTNAALENDQMAIQRQKWLLERYRTVKPNVVINPSPYRYEAQTFLARLAAGQLEDTYAVYFTEPQKLIANGYAADVTQYVQTFPYLKEVSPAILAVTQDAQGKIYGIAHDAYGLGLMYNRDLFTQAGLDPDKPPQTWAELRTMAKTIQQKLPGVDGFNLRNEGGLGGWMIVTLMYTFGGETEKLVGGKWTAVYNNAEMAKAMQLMKDLRWTDQTTTPNITGWGNFPQVQDFAAGKVAMTIAAGDTLKWMVGNMPDFKFTVAGFGRMPDGGANATLGGGNVWLYNPKTSPAVLAEAVAYNLWRDFDLESMENDVKAQVERKDLVGFPMLNIFTGEYGVKRQEIIAKYANAPVKNYANFNNSKVTVRGEPPVEAQALYTELGLVLQQVLADKNSDIPALLAASVAKFQAQVLDTVKTN